MRGIDRTALDYDGAVDGQPASLCVCGGHGCDLCDGLGYVDEPVDGFLVVDEYVDALLDEAETW